MNDLYCPYCYRKLFEIDVAFGICPMCNSLFEVWKEEDKIIVTKIGAFDKKTEEREEEE